MQKDKLEKLCKALFTIWNKQNAYKDKDLFIIDLAFTMQRIGMYLKNQNLHDDDASLYLFAKDDDVTVAVEGYGNDIAEMITAFLKGNPQIKNLVMGNIIVNDLIKMHEMSSD